MATKINISIYLSRINTLVNNFIKTINSDYRARMGYDFSAFMNDDIIEWSLLCTDNNDEAFYENFISRYPIAKQFHIFTLSILHEIGHLETENEMINDWDIRYNSLSTEEYFNLHNERIATDWAGNWIMDNLKQALDFDTKIQKIILNFYEKTLTK